MSNLSETSNGNQTAPPQPAIAELIPPNGQGIDQDLGAIQIDLEFASILPKPTVDELKQLEANLLEDGVCHDALVVWQEHNIVLGGHHRLPICKKHKIPCQIVHIDLPDREAAERWIILDQLGRRNLTPDQASYFRGKLYNAEKQGHGGDRKSEGSSAQNEQSKTTAEKMGEAFGVSPATIRRDGEYAEGIDNITQVCGGEAKDEILSSRSGLTRQDVSQLGKEQDPEVVKRVVAAGKGKAGKGQGKKPKSSTAASGGKKSPTAKQPGVTGGETITLPTEPNSLVDALVEKVGPELARRIYRLLGQRLKRMCVAP